MCLYTTQIQAFTSNEPITVYKVITRFRNRPPYYDRTRDNHKFKYHYGTNAAVGKEEIAKTKQPGSETQLLVINGGFLHAHATSSGAEFMKYGLGDCDMLASYKIVEMTIPPGTPYYVGEHKDICAKELYWEPPKLLKKILKIK